MTTLQEIFVDINGANRYVTVSAKAEDDAGRIVLINLLDNGALYALPAGAEARAVMIRPNGTKALITAQVIDGKVQLTMKSSMLILGTSQVEILLSTTDGKVITTAKFAIKVHGTQSTAGMEQSDDWSALRDALSKLSKVPAAEDVATLKAAVALVNGRLQKQAQTTHIQAVLAAKFKPTAEGTYEAPVYLNLTSAARQYGTALTLADGGVKIGKGVSKVRVTGQAYMYEITAQTQCEMCLYIVKADGTAKRIERCIRAKSAKYETYITGQIVTAVSEGDIIKLAYIGKPDTSFINYNDSTMLNVTVEEWDLSTAAGADLSADDVLLNKWHTGITINGAVGTEQVYPKSGITTAYTGDLYLNTDTAAVYQCTASGMADKATWRHVAVLSNILPGKVTDEILANAAVTTEKIADGAVTGSKIGFNTIEEKNIAPYAITYGCIAENAIDEQHLMPEISDKLKSYVRTIEAETGSDATLNDWYKSFFDYYVMRKNFGPCAVSVGDSENDAITLHADDAKSGNAKLTVRSGALVLFYAERDNTKCAMVIQPDEGIAVLRRYKDASGDIAYPIQEQKPVETWEPVFSKTFDADTTANQRWDLAKPCKKIRLRMAVAGSVANSAAGDQTVYISSYTSKCFLPNAFRYETATTKGAFVVAEIEIAEDMVRVLVNKGNISSGFNAANLMTGGTIWAASGITFNVFKDVEGHGAIKALSFPTNGKTIGAGTQVEVLGVAK